MNKLIGEYYITKKIGKGEYGDVYLATHIKTKQKLAVKAVNNRRMKKETILWQFTKNEVKVLRKLNNPNVIEFFDIL